MTNQLRKTRFVCVSDTHNSSPEDGSFKLPKGDVLIHAGDLTKQGTLPELRTTLDWIDKADFEVKLVVAGNHDVTLDRDFYDQHGLDFHNQNPQDPRACIELVKQYQSIQYLNHEALRVELRKADGPQTAFTVFGSPYSPRHGLWAFGYEPYGAAELWEKIPLETDVVITHTPPKYHCDEKMTKSALGCEPLREALWRIRPSLAVCGHVHEGRGVERVTWDLDSPNIKFKESSTEHWEDPGQGNKKQSLVDLTAKGRKALQNRASLDRPMPKQDNDTAGAAGDLSTAVRGQGGAETSGRCDKQALWGRTDRRETCIINAAIMASSWPYKAKMGRKHNKPIVVDIDLPVLS